MNYDKIKTDTQKNGGKGDEVSAAFQKRTTTL